MFYINRLQGISEPVVFDVEVVTPMFLGGADKNIAELRAASIKGVLRFWWRALYGAQEKDLDAMRKKEAEIFGSTENKASFSLQVIGRNINIQNNIQEKNNNDPLQCFSVHNRPVNIIDYLCYGVYKNPQTYLKSHIKSGSTFVVKFIFNNAKFKDQVINSFLTMINYGGIGARHRNGLGSLQISNNDQIINKVNFQMSNFSALSTETKIFVSNKKFNNWYHALSHIGIIYRNAKTKIEHRTLIKRQLITAPISINVFENGRLNVLAKNNSRHSKPYHLHIKKCSDGSFQGQILFMPYKYSPNNRYDQNLFMNYQKSCNEINQYILQAISQGGN